MRIVFVIPPFDYGRSVGHVRRGARRGVLPPLGVGFLAAELRKHGHACRLVDAMARNLNAAETAEAVAALRPETVGISLITFVNERESVETCREIRRRVGPDVPIILGGPHVTLMGGRALETFPEADYAVCGEGEYPLRTLAEYLERGERPAALPGVSSRDSSGRIISSPPLVWESNLDVFDPPDRSLYERELYRPLPSLNLGRDVTTIITARGCPWARCAFCHQGSGCSVPYRRRSPGHVLDEVEKLVRDWGYTSLVFWDDDFCAMPEWVETFCDGLIRSGYRIRWSVLARASSVREDMLRHMAEAGCYSIQFGFESGVPEILKLIRKGATPDLYRRAVRWARNAGLEIRGSFMLGFPTETPEMSRQTIELACELNADYMLFFAYHVLPGTALEGFALERGRRVPGWDQNIHQPSYVPDTYGSAEELAAMVRYAYRRYYLRPAYLFQLGSRTLRRPWLIGNHALSLGYWIGAALRG
ncbi:MAG TPA: radical SAM protein [Candidatus Hydrogenedentes bacterium]|nr:radical SAM protein [Candidatus Hydrogenedentota bacterium]